MLSYLFACLIWIPSLIGFGYACERYLFSPIHREQTLGELGLMGFMCLALLAMVVNFFSSLNAVISVATAVAGIALFGKFANDLVPRLNRESLLSLLVLLLCTGTSVLLLNHSYDAGLFQLPLASSAKKAPLVIGYGNLYLAFGRPSSWYPLGALLWLPGLGLTSAFSLNSILCIFFLWHVFLLFRFQRGNLGRNTVFSSSFIIGILLCSPFFLGFVKSLSADLPVLVYGTYSWLCFLESFESGDEQKSRLAWLALISSVFAVTAKVSGTPWLLVGLASLAISLVAAVNSGKDALKSVFLSRPMLWVGALTLAWLAKGLLLTGCPLYPKALGCLHFLPWTLPQEQVLLGLQDIEKMNWGSSVRHGQTLQQWLFTWLTDYFQAPQTKRLIAMAVASLGLILVSLFTGKGRRHSSSRQLLPIGFALLSGMVAIWFVSMPAARFGFGYWLALTSMLGAIGLGRLGWTGRAAKPVVIVLFFLAAATSIRAAITTRASSWSWHDWPSLPPVEFESRDVDGYKVQVPKNDYRCWNQELYCTPSRTRFRVVGHFLGYPIFGAEAK